MYIYIKALHHLCLSNFIGNNGRMGYLSVAIIAPWFGEVAEWSNVLDSKSSVLSKVPWVRIPPSPPYFHYD